MAYSNTTLVKVKFTPIQPPIINPTNSNTTLVKVKLMLALQFQDFHIQFKYNSC